MTFMIMRHSREQDLYVNLPFLPNKILPLVLNELTYLRIVIAPFLQLEVFLIAVTPKLVLALQHEDIDTFLIIDKVSTNQALACTI